jgi:hypothetical protein
MRTWKVWQPHKGERAAHATEVEAFDADAAVEQVHEDDYELDADEMFCVQAYSPGTRGRSKVQVIPSTREYVPSASTSAPLTVERLRARCSCGVRFFDRQDPGRDGLCRRCWFIAWETRGNERAREVRATAIGQLLDQGVLRIKEEPQPAAMGEITKDVAAQASDYLRKALDDRLADLVREVEET